MRERMLDSKLVGGVGALVAATLLIALATPGQAALFIVDNKVRETGDWNPGDGICAYSSVPGSRCTLRAAVQEANALSGADVILIPHGWYIALSNTIYGDEDFASSGDLDIRDDVTIASFLPPGPEAWPIVDGGGIDAVFDVHSPATLTLSGLQITGGDQLGIGTGKAGGIWVRSGAGGNFSDCRFFGNRGANGAVANDGDTTISGCSLDGNLGNNGSESAAISNRAILEVVRSEVSGNLEGVGIYNAAGAGLIIRNSTITNNYRGGIKSEGDLLLRNVTITKHALSSGLSVFQPGAFLSPTIHNTIIANNAQDCSILIPGGISDTAHPNLDSDGTCGFLPAFGGLPNTDPKLGPLQLNGGTTRTMVPGVGSPVIDKGNNGTCEAGDQRGASRPLDGDGVGGAHCDIGAVEVLPCFQPVHGVVSSVVLSVATTVVACNTITVGPAVDIVTPGDVTFRTRDAVIFGNGFSVHPGGEFEVILDPAAASGITLP